MRGARSSYESCKSTNFTKLRAGVVRMDCSLYEDGQGKWWARAEAQREEIELLPQTPQSERDRERERKTAVQGVDVLHFALLLLLLLLLFLFLLLLLLFLLLLLLLVLQPLARMLISMRSAHKTVY